MIVSMTGYGAAERSVDGVRYSLELRSLNHRYFKATIRLPEHLQIFEAEIEKLLRTRLARGSVAFLLRVKDESAQAAYTVNQAALQAYVDQIGQARVPEGMQVTLDLAVLAALPGVFQPPDMDEPTRSRYWDIVRGLTLVAMDALVEMRAREGQALREDLLRHASDMRSHLQSVAELAPVVVQDYQKKLQERVNHLLSEAKLVLEQDAVVREVALFADRCDIGEEIARLRCHLDQFQRLFDTSEHAGRKLDFLAQEMLREANTIGSKSNHAAITGHVVEIKGRIDRLKEQVQNVE
jgi:uncharacterized protein (TIGR00255 family)